MKTHKTNLRLRTLFSLIVVSVCTCLLAQRNNQDKNKSPYFIVVSENGDKEQFPLKSTNVSVDISGVIADVHVKQVYANTGEQTIEAIYVFPASTKAAVYDMVMKVDDRVIRAVIEEKGLARKKYNSAKKKGKTASLLEEERPNVFKMNVANITPGARVEVDLYYTELLVPTEKVYEFVYPTVVGPRYSSGSSEEEWVVNPYLKEGTSQAPTIDIEVSLNTGMPIQHMQCVTHKNNIQYSDKSKAQLKLIDSYGGNRDFILRYGLAGNYIESGVLTYQDPSGENYFLAMMQAPEQVKTDLIPAREYVFIVDVSGSMSGFPLDISKNIMRKVLEQLEPSDLFNIVFFAGGSELYSSESLPANSHNIQSAIEYMNNIDGSGGTELLSALKNAMKLNNNPNYARSFIILTDGYVTVEAQTFDYIRSNLGIANFFSFGIGSSVNRHIIEGMAHVGYGEAFVAENIAVANQVANRFVKYVSNPVLTNIQYKFEGFEVYDVLPTQIPDLFANRPLVIAGKYKGEANGKLTIKGINGQKEYLQTININAKSKQHGKALKYLWAREKIRLLSDYNNLSYQKTEKEEIVALSKKYNLLTEYTSFLAIDNHVSNVSGTIGTIRQPVTSPKGVNPYPITRKLSIVEDDIELCEELEFDCESEEDVIIEFNLEEDEKEAETIPFFLIETNAEFPGGVEALKQFIASNLKYPPIAAESGIQGRVYVTFTVDVDGSIKDVKVVRGICPSVDAEAIRIVKSMPKWKPGKQRGRSVPMSYTVPINFKLE
ncbi:TonB family protein [Labilibacter marinus]|uniref:TonB family protein n=1 Tax=Labilibacter marinus TaxID=1477105 RepID=UPI00117A73BF|nr:TonB family protein [Labilibacter marinus]